MSIRLIKDKSHIHPSLKVGALGSFRRNLGIDVYNTVYFPCANMEVRLFDRDWEYAKTEEEQRVYNLKLETAYDVEYKTGPRGGFRCIKFHSKTPRNSYTLCDDRDEGMKIIEFFKEKNIPINTVIDK